MKACIVSIGSEITSGQNLDTNSQWLSRRLAEVGIPVGLHASVSDDHADNVRIFRQAIEHYGLVIATGGLGPTLDDLTRDVLAEVAGVPLRFDQASFDHIASLFASRNRPMPERNRVQAMVPSGAHVLDNPIGTAPGIWMRIGPSWVAAMPGVPREMVRMYDEQLLPRLAALGVCAGVRIERKINCFGAGESQVEEKVSDLTKRGHVPEVGITASDAVISLRITAQAGNRAEALSQIEPDQKTICDRLGDWVFGFDDEELHDVVVRLLRERQLTVGTAESVTAGEVVQRLVRVPGASEVVRGGLVAYVNDVKRSLLDVPPQLLAEHGAVSAPVATAMAESARRILGVDLAVSTTGLAGPGDAGEGKPIGLCFVGLAWTGGSEVHRVNWFGSRSEIQSRASKSALNLIRLHLLRRT